MSAVGRVVIRDSGRVVVRLGAVPVSVGSSGTLNHAALTSNLVWTTSAHTGTAGTLAGFSGAGAASLYLIGTSAGQVAAGDHLHTGVYQPSDAGLTSLSSLPTVADRIAYSTAADVWAETALTSFARTVLDDTTAAAARTTLDVEVAQTLTDAATIAVDWSLGQVARVVLGGARTLGMPTNPVSGRIYTLVFVQDATGDRSIEFPASFSTKPEIGRAANETTVHRFYYDGTNYKIVGHNSTIRIPCTADTSDSAPADTTITGMTFTPVPNGVYQIRGVFGYVSAASTTGGQFRVDPGNATGGALGGGVGTSATVLVSRVTNAQTTSAGNVSSLSVPSTTVPVIGIYEIVVTAAASPSAISGKFQTEIGGSACTMKAGICYLEVTRLA